MTDLEKLVSGGELAAAIELVDGWTPRRIAAAISGDGPMGHPEAFVDFFSGLIEREPDAAIRYELGRWFAQAFLGELAPAPTAAAIGAEIHMTAVQGMIDELARVLRSAESTAWVENPDRTLPSATVERWHTYADQLDGIDLTPLPAESAGHRAEAESEFASFGEAWSDTFSPAQQRRVAAGRDRYDVRGDS